MPRSFRLSFALVLLLLAPVPPLVARERPSRLPLTPPAIAESLRTDWYGVYVESKKVGYARISLSRAGEAEGAGLLLGLHLRIKLLSEGEAIDLQFTQDLEFEGKPPYGLRRGKSTQGQGQAKQETSLVRTAKGLDVVSGSGDDRTTKQVAAPDYTLADALTSYVWLRGRPKVGATLRSRDLDVEEARVYVEGRKMLATKTALVKGVKVTYHEVEATSARHGLTTLERYDDKGNLLSGRIGEAFELRLEPEELAKTLDASFDLFLLGLVKIDRPLGDPLKVAGMTVELIGKNAGLLETGPRQTVTRNPSGSFTCKIGAPHGKAVRATAEEISDNLAATASYQLANPRVKALAREAVGDAKTEREKVERLVRFVHDYIEPSYRIKGVVLLEVMEKKEGDCTAYALLFTALARAAGVPAREVSGLLYIGDAQKAFGGHAWNEVVLDGQWLPVDASTGEVEVNATHLSFGSDLRGGINLMRNLGGLSLRLVDVQHKE